ncbi:SpaN/EivJ family type III secretion system needle length determinant [Iodobacter fluviatilis]|uniref:Antigen presentation protein SpaN n=1 Tax=Iodobacter fluviatilis TaxID=537 RepID=A0A377Q4D8_9NEIS|nr:type III secretion system needle length determinant, SpaN/EivJ family [Iodobacter fluviatilis]TCU80247.1 surface presentation of antigens protein [Iodobacter fluviatilis]STQ90136.1 antigen presentation protein SpaN [Iodobacter fluviatilis]
MKIHSLGGKHLGLEERSTGVGDALASAHAQLVFNAHAKFADADALKIMLQGLQDTDPAPLLDTLGMDLAPPDCQINCVNAQSETDSSADLGVALPLSWAPNLIVVLDSLCVLGLPQARVGESTSLLGDKLKQNVGGKCLSLDPLAKGEMKSLGGQDALVSLQTLSLLTSVVPPSVVGAKRLDVERLHNTPQSMRKVSRLQEQEERGLSSLFSFLPIINQLSEPTEVPMSIGEGDRDFVAALPAASTPTLPLAGTYETKGVGPALNVTMSGVHSPSSSVELGSESMVLAAMEHFTPSVVGGVPDSSLAVGAQSELAMLAPSSVEEQIVGPLVLARGSKVSAVLPVFVGNDSASELPASTSQAGQAERPVRAQELVTSASLQMLPEPNLNGPHYEFVSNPGARPMPAPVLQVIPSPVEQQGLTYHFKSWGNDAFVNVNTLSAGDVRFVPSDVKVQHTLQTYGEDHDMPQHWRIEASERRDDDMPRRQARAQLAEEENEE